MDLKASLELLQKTTEQAVTPKVVLIPGDPDNVLVSCSGTLETRPLPPKHRCHKAHDLESLLELADKSKNGVLWHSNEAVVLVMDDDVRRDIATFTLQYSAPFLALLGISDGKYFDQKDLIRLLKVSLAGCVPPDLVAAVRTLRFTRKEDGHSAIEQGKTSLGRSVEANITGASAIPETFTVQTNVYANVLKDHAVRVEIAIDVELESHTFMLSVVGDGLTDALIEAQEQIAVALNEGASDDKPRRILFGSP